MPSSLELPQPNKLGIFKRLLLEKSTVEIASVMKHIISLHVKLGEKPVSV